MLRRVVLSVESVIGMKKRLVTVQGEKKRTGIRALPVLDTVETWSPGPRSETKGSRGSHE